MRRAEGERIRQLLPPFVERLAGPRIDEIDRDIAEDLERAVNGGAGGGGIMVAAEESQRIVAQGLDADGEPVDAGSLQAAQVSAQDVVGIGLKRDLGIEFHAEAGIRRGEDGLDLLRLEQRGRAATEIDRIERAMLWHARAVDADVVIDCLQERAVVARLGCVHIEVAVGANL